jgi:membrane protein DedA with SNARE-associated domain
LQGIPGSRAHEGYHRTRGAIAQLEERLDRTQEVAGSSPASSTRQRPLVAAANAFWDRRRLVQFAGLSHRVVPAAVAAAVVALAVAIATGVLEVPNVANAVADATDPLGGWIYLVVMALVFLETTVLVGFLIHGELILLLGGVAAERGDASLIAMVALAGAAALAGDVVSVLLGRRLGRPFLERHGARFRLGPAQIDRLDRFFARHGGKAVFVGRFTGLSRSTMPFVAGSSGLAVRRLLPFSVASALVWTGIFTALGYAFSESFAGAGDTATRVGFIGILLVAAAVFLNSRWRR